MELPSLSALDLKVQEDVWCKFGVPISWPDLGDCSYALFVAFGRCKFRLSLASISLIVEATINGDAHHFVSLSLRIEFLSSLCVHQSGGLFVLKLASFDCDLLKL